MQIGGGRKNLKMWAVVNLMIAAVFLVVASIYDHTYVGAIPNTFLATFMWWLSTTKKEN